jgi:hypothetical protein
LTVYVASHPAFCQQRPGIEPLSRPGRATPVRGLRPCVWPQVPSAPSEGHLGPDASRGPGWLNSHRESGSVSGRDRQPFRGSSFTDGRWPRWLRPKGAFSPEMRDEAFSDLLSPVSPFSKHACVAHGGRSRPRWSGCRRGRRYAQFRIMLNRCWPMPRNKDILAIRPDSPSEIGPHNLRSVPRSVEPNADRPDRWSTPLNDEIARNPEDPDRAPLCHLGHRTR